MGDVTCSGYQVQYLISIVGLNLQVWAVSFTCIRV